ncbi:MAG: formate dehydrogenase subunit gamma [Desulfobaccales bacterium]
MNDQVRVIRFNVIHRLFHLFVMVTFLIQGVTGLSRLLYATSWGKALTNLLGGYESVTTIHIRVGVAMLLGFTVHIVYILLKVEWKSLRQSLFHPDSLMPQLQDAIHVAQRLRWFLGLGPPPAFDRWTYWEKFDYMAVFWGIPLLGVTGLLLMNPLFTSDFLPGWMLNVTLLLHRAEALLAMLYIFIIHFTIGHFRHGAFPMNECMFAGSVELEELRREKPLWIVRLEEDGKLEEAMVPGPPRWFRVAYFIFGFTALAVGLYLLVVILIYRNYV